MATDAAGNYAVTASSTDPVAETTFTFTVAAPTTTTTAAEATTTTVVEADGTTTTAAADDADAGDSSNLAGFVGVGLLVIAAGVGAFFAIRWWRSRSGDASPS